MDIERVNIVFNYDMPEGTFHFRVLRWDWWNCDTLATVCTGNTETQWLFIRLGWVIAICAHGGNSVAVLSFSKIDLVPHTIVNRVIVVQCYLAPERKFLWGTPRIIWISESYLKLRDFDPIFRFWHLSPSCRPRRSIRYKGIGNLIHRWWRGWKNSKICSRTIRGNCYRTSWRNWHLNLHWRPIDWL